MRKMESTTMVMYASEGGSTRFETVPSGAFSAGVKLGSEGLFSMAVCTELFYMDEKANKTGEHDRRCRYRHDILFSLTHLFLILQ